VAVQAAHTFRKLLRVGQRGGGTVAIQLVAAVQTFETGEELAAKDAAGTEQIQRAAQDFQRLIFKLEK
jgi:hypothetical protein